MADSITTVARTSTIAVVVDVRDLGCLAGAARARATVLDAHGRLLGRVRRQELESQARRLRALADEIEVLL